MVVEENGTSSMFSLLGLGEQIFIHSPAAMMVTDLSGQIVAVNPAFTETTGYEVAEVLGKNPSMLKSGRHDLAFYRALWASLEKEGKWQGEIWNRHRSGRVYPEWLTLAAVRDRAGAKSHYVAIFSDISKAKGVDDRTMRNANFDALTELPNRILLLDRFELAMARALRNQTDLAVLFVDLDGFKLVNDQFGHDVGDRVLQIAASRLTASVRAVDTIARYGGDEFILLLEDITAPDLNVIVRRILTSQQQPIPATEGRECIIGVSLGIALYPTDGTSAQELIHKADLAMYESKKHGRNRATWSGMPPAD